MCQRWQPKIYGIPRQRVLWNPVPRLQELMTNKHIGVLNSWLGGLPSEGSGSFSAYALSRLAGAEC